MPETVTIRDQETVIATEQETLDFCNRVREAGGAEFIPALFPATPKDANSCLIARAFNFDCEIDARGDDWTAEMQNIAAAREIARALNLLIEVDEWHGYARVYLPETIGNVAAAFDARVGWPAEYDDTDVDATDD